MERTSLLAPEIAALAALVAVKAADLSPLREAVARLAGEHGRVSPALQQALFDAEAALRPLFDAGAARAFQTIVAAVGGKLRGPIHIPELRVPYWFEGDGPPGAGAAPAGTLVGFRSSEALPERAEYVLIGAGMTGASAVRGLLGEVRAGKRVVVLESGDRPACGASGKNGGNIEMLKESFLTDYRGFVEVQKDLLRQRFPGLPAGVVEARALAQSRCLLRFFQANVREIRATVGDGIDADLCMNGWLRIAETPAEEQGLLDEVLYAASLGLDFEVWTPERIALETGIRSDRRGRFIAESGNYHPYKFVQGVFRRALDEGVLLYTRTRVKRIERGEAAGDVVVHTCDGPIRAAKVIVATNAYTPELLAGTGFVEPRISHLCDLRHVENTFRGRSITCRQGDWYAAFPRQDWYEDAAGVARGTLLVGGGYDTPIAPDEVHAPPFIDLVYHAIREDTARMIPGTQGQPPLRAWSGVMGFTADRAPVLSFFHDHLDSPPDMRIVLAVAFNGYGGSQCAIAGKVAASLAVHGAPPADIALPDDVFSMRRFLTDEPLFCEEP